MLCTNIQLGTSQPLWKHLPPPSPVLSFISLSSALQTLQDYIGIFLYGQLTHCQFHFVNCHFVNFLLCQFPLCQHWPNGNWLNWNWQSEKLTKMNLTNLNTCHCVKLNLNTCVKYVGNCTWNVLGSALDCYMKVDRLYATPTMYLSCQSELR